MTKVKIPELAFVRLQSPDLDVAEEFLSHFGMLKVDRTATRLFMRGTDGNHHLHVTELGDPKVLGFGYLARDAGDLARLGGAGAVHESDEPGGGKRVLLTDPLGFRIDVLADVERLPPVPVSRQPYNLGAHGILRNDRYSVPRGASSIKRIGHCVVHTQDLPQAVRWYRETLGFLATDDVWAGEPDHVIASFNRLDRGDEPVDHHVIFFVARPRTGMNHISFEVQDFDDVMAGHQHLKSLGRYAHAWGVGRHYLGSQIFDYWKDPWGRIHEHWTDTDLMNAAVPPAAYPVEIGFASQWGDDAPEAFVSHSSR